MSGPQMGGIILLVDNDQGRAVELAGRLRAVGFLTIVCDPAALPAALERWPPARDAVDIALIQLGGKAGNAIALGQQVLGRDACTDVIFFAERDCLDLVIARSLGVNRLISADALPEWIVSSAAALVRWVHARRALADAQQHLPVIPPPVWSPPEAMVPLPVAEQRFRETFLRRLLMHSPSRETAARIAGVPYRTLCDMLQKLEIGSTPRQ